MVVWWLRGRVSWGEVLLGFLVICLNGVEFCLVDFVDFAVYMKHGSSLGWVVMKFAFIGWGGVGNVGNVGIV